MGGKEMHYTCSPLPRSLPGNKRTKWTSVWTTQRQGRTLPTELQQLSLCKGSGHTFSLHTVHTAGPSRPRGPHIYCTSPRSKDLHWPQPLLTLPTYPVHFPWPSGSEIHKYALTWLNKIRWSTIHCFKDMYSFDSLEQFEDSASKSARQY